VAGRLIGRLTGRLSLSEPPEARRPRPYHIAWKFTPLVSLVSSSLFISSGHFLLSLLFTLPKTLILSQQFSSSFVVSLLYTSVPRLLSALLYGQVAPRLCSSLVHDKQGAADSVAQTGSFELTELEQETDCVSSW